MNNAILNLIRRFVPKVYRQIKQAGKDELVESIVMHSSVCVYEDDIGNVFRIGVVEK